MPKLSSKKISTLTNLIKHQHDFDNITDTKNLIFVGCNATINKYDKTWLFHNSNITFKDIQHRSIDLRKHDDTVFSFINCKYCNFLSTNVNKINGNQFSNFTVRNATEFKKNWHTHARILNYDGYVQRDGNSYSCIEFMPREI